VIAPLVTFTFVGRPVRVLAAAFVASIAIAEVAAACSFLPVPIVKFLAFASCFMGGVIMARTGLPRAVRIVLAIVGAAWVAASLWSQDVNGHIGYGLLYMAAVAETLEPSSGLKRVLSKPIFVWFGERSYSIFLTHFSAIVLSSWAVSHFTPHKGVEFFVASRLLACVLSLLVACVLFEGVERRFAHGLVTAGQWLPWHARLVESSRLPPDRSTAPGSP
jgi:peptidoglycan/LPS O-acetylase OafA/YrhL